MQVKDVIKDTKWHPSSNWAAQQPKISVLLPTFCRAASGLFEKTVNAILQQTFTDFELIIVDDASTDGTKDLIQSFMQQDPRISYLHHPENIGLPAISEYEAFMKARGEYIVFAFDDFIFEPDAFENLYNAVHQTPYLACHGIARLYYIDKYGEYDYLSLGEGGVEFLSQTNTIANSSVIVHRTILNTVGLYDPHILLARTCDWDLWLRIAKKFAIKKIDVLIGGEYGAATNNSLGRTYFNHLALVKEYVTTDRNLSLLPSNFAEYNFIDDGIAQDSYVRFYINEATQFYINKSWYKSLTLPANNKTPKRILFYGPHSATNYYICFSGLNHAGSSFLVEHVCPSETANEVYWMLRADMIIFNREINISLKKLQILNDLNIPCYYFIDDNLIELRKETGAVELEWFTIENLKSNLQSMRGILVSSPALLDYFKQNELHTNIQLYTPMLDFNLLNNLDCHKEKSSKGLTVAILGGSFRLASTIAHVIPALNELNKTIPVTLYTRKGFLPNVNDCEFNCQQFEFKSNFYQFIHQLRLLNIDLIIHPAGDTCNISYKTDSILLTALYINANIILSDELAFAGLNEEQGVLKVADDQSEISVALNTIVNNDHATLLKSKLHQYCLNHFSQEKNLDLLNSIITTQSNMTYLTYERRTSLLIDMLANKIQELEAAPPIYINVPQVIHVEPTPSKSWSNRLNHLIHSIKKQDLSSLLSSSFYDLVQYTKKTTMFNKKLKLFIRPIPRNSKKYLEYTVPVPSKEISEISLALSANRNHTGSIGVEISLPNDETNIKVMQDITSLNFNNPIVFRFNKIALSAHDHIKVKVFTREIKHPFYVYHLSDHSWLRKNTSILFCDIK